jgi:hypothetical protein
MKNGHQRGQKPAVRPAADALNRTARDLEQADAQEMADSEQLIREQLQRTLEHAADWISSHAEQLRILHAWREDIESEMLAVGAVNSAEELIRELLTAHRNVRIGRRAA